MAETTAFGNGGRKGTAFGLLGAILLAAGLLRVWGASGDLWLDEVWYFHNVEIARALNSIDWVGFYLHFNIHTLNALTMAAVGPDAGPFAYRALSVASGVATVAVAAAIGWRRSPLEGLIAAALVAASYPMVHYASEARGYGPMLLAALAAFYLLETILEDPGPAPNPWRVLAFIGVSLLGLASHLTFAVVEAALGIWAAVVLYPRLRSLVPVLARLTVLFGVQAAAFTAYGAVAWNNMAFGVRPTDFSNAESVGVMAALAFGVDPAAKVSLTPVLGLILAAAVWGLYRLGDRSWIFFFILILVYPLAFIIIDPPADAAPRHFIASALLALIVTARFLAIMMAEKPWGLIAAGAALVLFFIGNGLLLDKFFAAGRGNPQGLLETIADGSDGPVRVAGYRRLRVGPVLRYYARRLGLGDDITFVAIEEDERDPAPWFIDGGFNDGFGGRQPEPVIIRSDGQSGSAPYKLVAVYPHWGLSGDSLALYRRAD